MFKSDVDLYLTADKRVVAADDPDATYFLVNAGREISEAELESLGVDVKAAKAFGKGSKAEPEPENKAVDGPQENKSKK